jgi:hypothetical protein
MKYVHFEKHIYICKCSAALSEKNKFKILKQYLIKIKTLFYMSTSHFNQEHLQMMTNNLETMS